MFSVNGVVINSQADDLLNCGNDLRVVHGQGRPCLALLFVPRSSCRVTWRSCLLPRVALSVFFFSFHFFLSSRARAWTSSSEGIGSTGNLLNKKGQAAAGLRVELLENLLLSVAKFLLRVISKTTNWGPLWKSALDVIIKSKDTNTQEDGKGGKECYQKFSFAHRYYNNLIAKENYS